MKLSKYGKCAFLALLGVALIITVACEVGNNPPQITSLSADPSIVAPGEICTITCVASDPNGDPLTYSWKYTGPHSASIPGANSTVKWTAADEIGTYTIRVTVADDRGGTVEELCNVVVGVATGSIDVKSSPAGAGVYLDGVDTDNITPYVITDVAPGNHTIKLTLFEYKDRQGNVTVTVGDTAYINWPLEEAEWTTVTIQPGPAEGKDGFVYFADPAINKGSEIDIYAGADAVNRLLRSYLQFDLSTISSTAAITSAELGLYYANTGIELNASIGAYRVDTGWEEGVITWLAQPNSASTPVDVNAVPAVVTGDFVEWDITDLVQGWIDGSVANYGVLLRDTDEATAETFKAFWSSDWGNPAERPRLVITYYDAG